MAPQLRLAGLLLAGLLLGGGSPATAAPSPQPGSAHAAYGTIPPSVEDEHRELHAELDALTQVKGSVGQAAVALRTALDPHFRKEEAFALPPLSLLSELSQRHLDPGMRAMMKLTDQLKRDLPQMLAEHRAIGAKLRALRQAGQQAKNERAVRFADALERHARQEEEILYPASLLVGEYLHVTFGAFEKPSAHQPHPAPHAP